MLNTTLHIKKLFLLHNIPVNSEHVTIFGHGSFFFRKITGNIA